MNAAEFVELVKVAVLEAAVTSTIANITSPPGRRPSAELMAAHQGYTQMNESERHVVEHVARIAARDAVFGLMSLIDGTRLLGDAAGKGQFRLTFQNAEGITTVNPSDGPYLHDLLGIE